MVRRCWWIGLSLVVLAAIGIYLVVPTGPLAFIASYEVSRGPTMPERNGVTARDVYFIRAPSSKIHPVLESYQQGKGSAWRGKNMYGYGNSDTKEAWMLARGKGAWPEWPYLGTFVPEPGTENTWCTLAYCPPRGFFFFEWIRRLLA
jgi:hypothetical protein